MTILVGGRTKRMMVKKAAKMTLQEEMRMMKGSSMKKADQMTLEEEEMRRFYMREVATVGQ